MLAYAAVFLSGLGYLLAVSLQRTLCSVCCYWAGSRDFGDLGRGCRHRFDTGASGVVGSLHIGRVICRAVSSPTAQWRWARRWACCVLCTGRVTGTALTVIGVALFAILLALPASVGEGEQRRSRYRFARCWGVSGCMVPARWRWPRRGFGVIATFITAYMMLKAGMAPPLRSRYLARRVCRRAFAVLLTSVIPSERVKCHHDLLWRRGDYWSVTGGGDGSHAVDGKSAFYSQGMGFSLVFSGAGRERWPSKAVPPQNECGGIPSLWICLWGYRAAGRLVMTQAEACR